MQPAGKSEAAGSRRRRWTFHPGLVLLGLLLLVSGRGGTGLLLFGLVLAHEGAHAAMAWLYGLRPERVELFPFGGRSVIGGLEWAGPAVAVRVALAGPLINVALAAVAQLAWVQQRLPLDFLAEWERFNLSLAVVNCLPVLPLDGGWLARAILGARWGWVGATQRLAGWGAKVGLLFAVAGAMQWLWRAQGGSWVIFGLFLWVAGRREAQEAAVRYQQQLLRRFSGIPGNLPMVAQWVVAEECQPLHRVVTGFAPHQYHLVAVLNRRGELTDILSESELWQRAQQAGSVAPVRPERSDRAGRTRHRC